MSWHFLCMLVFMTFNVGACVVLILGITVGHFFTKSGAIFKVVTPVTSIC